MAEGLTLADGTPVDVDAAAEEFRVAMAAPEPGDAPDMKAPPRRDPDAPRGARPVKGADDKPRTAKRVPAAAPRGAKGKTADVPKQDFSQGLTEVGTAVWVGLAALPLTRPYSVLWKAQLAAQVSAWNQAAQENVQVRAKVARIASGEGGMWVLGVALATGPLIGGVIGMLTADPKVRAQYAAKAEADLSEWLDANVQQDEPAGATA